MEALTYFKNRRAEFAANHFNRKEALSFCKRLYKLGANQVDIDILDPNEEDGPVEETYADALTVSLPKKLSKSRRLDIVVAILNEHPDEISTTSHFMQDVNWGKDTSFYLWWD